MVIDYKGIWYEFISPNNIAMVCLGDYNMAITDDYGWGRNSENYDGKPNLLRMVVGSSMSKDEHYDIWYNLSTNILSFDAIEMDCKINEICELVKRTVNATGWEVPSLYSIIPDGFDKYMRLAKINKLLGDD